MNIATISTTDHNPQKWIEAYTELTEKLGAQPDLLFLSCSVDYNPEELFAYLKENSPDMPIHGGTSCRGVMTGGGSRFLTNGGLAMLGISDPEGSYGVGSSVIKTSPEKAAKEAVERALLQSGCIGEVPAQVWLTTAPGFEESIINGIEDVLGDDIPISGGSSADNTVSGNWRQFANGEVLENGIVVTTFFPSTEIFVAFHSGYEPTIAQGMVTKAGQYLPNGPGTVTSANHRILQEIDNKPASRIYNDWTAGLIEEKLGTDANILAETSLYPLGRIAGYIGEIPYYQLSHPETTTKDGGMTLFTNIKEGETVVLMRGTIESLISRAGRVATSALDTSSVAPEDIAGALIVYCAGCMLTVEERLDEVIDSFRRALPGVPFLGTFTFGEQGHFLNVGNKHGNLMISVLLFSKNN